MQLTHFSDGGFFGVNNGPLRNAPGDWIVWHFTPVANLPDIAAAGELHADYRVGPHENIANVDIKLRRLVMPVEATNYPPGRMVGEHVPWYIAGKSPMLYVLKEHAPDIVFFGMQIGDALAHGVEWCVSDGNAAARVTQFSSDLATVGDFVDFDLLGQKDWFNTNQDSDRKRRRAAEFLAYDRVPLSAMSLVVASNKETLKAAMSALVAEGHTHFTPRLDTSLFY